MGKRINVPTGTELGDTVGYSRAVRIGNRIEVSGTAAVDDQGKPAGEDGYTQTKFILGKIEKALKVAGGSLEDVIRTRMFVTDLDHVEGVGRAHGEFFGEIKPASALFVISALALPGLLVEIEASAVVDD